MSLVENGVPEMRAPKVWPLGFIAGAIVIAIWGTSPAATFLAAQDIPGAAVGALRIIGSALAILPLVWIMRLKLPKEKSGWLELLTSAVAGFGIGTILMSIGVPMTSTAHSGLIMAVAPVLTGFFGFALSKNWPRKFWWAGAAIALVGQAILIFSKSDNPQDIATLEGDLLVLISILFVSAGYIAGSRVSARIGTWAATAWAIIFAALFIIPFAPFWIGNFSFQQIGMTSLSALLFLIFFITIICYALWFWALDRDGAAKIAPIQFCQPLVSLFLAVIWLGEFMSFTIALATSLILIGVMVCRKYAR